MANKRKRKHYSKLIKDVGKCELCGMGRGLEAHHIIPLTTQFGELDLDTEENIIVVCSACHAKLTNKSLLIRYGCQKAAMMYNLRVGFYNKFSDCIEEISTPADVCDVFDEWLNDNYEYITGHKNKMIF